MKNSDAENIGRLFDFAADRPEGFTYQDIQKELDWDKSYFTKIHRKLRLLLASDDQINLICDPQGQHQPWLYRLVGNIEGARAWVGNRLRDSESRILTIRAICASLVRATDGRSSDGRRARIMQRGLTRILEDLAELDHGSPLF